MRTVTIPGTEFRTSCLGMGCASLGSRISKDQGLRALAAACDRGVTWFDVAPAYGAGDAEAILGTFLSGRRPSVFVCSKVGLTTPANNRAIKLIYKMGRPFIGLAQGLRRRFRRISATRNARIPLTPETIEISVQNSLTRLRTDYLDVLALHDPDPADLVRDEILAALEKVIMRGQARHLAVAGTLSAAEQAVRIPSFTILQLADDPAVRPLSSLRQRLDHPAGFITHSVFGVGGAKLRLMKKINDSLEIRGLLAESGFVGSPDTAATQLLLQRAFASNPDGVVLASMFSGEHLTENLRQAVRPPDQAAVQLLEQIYGC